MLQAHYMTSQKSKGGFARCVFAVYCSKEEHDEMFRNAPTMHHKVVAGWYDRAKREVCVRRAGPGEKGVAMHLVSQSSQSLMRFGKSNTNGLYQMMFTSQNLEFPLEFLFRQREAAGRIVNVKGVPHLVWRLPTREEAEPPKMRKENRESLYNPQDHKVGDVRYISVPKLPPAPPSIQPEAKTVDEPAKATNGAHHQPVSSLPPIERLKISIARVNQLVAKIGNVHLAIKDGKLRGSVVTSVDL